MGIDIINAGVKAGLVDIPTDSPWIGTSSNGTYTFRNAAGTVLNLANNTAILVKVDGALKWLVKGASGTGSFVALSADGTIPTFATGVTVSTVQQFDLTAILNIMPSNFSKIFSSTNGNIESKDLYQTDCTALTTELKSFTSSQDSDTQLIQTQLSQYNDKRTEVLDDLSTLVKGTAGILNDIGRNLSAI